MTNWHCRAIESITQDFHRSADTHLLRLNLPFLDGVDLYLKDESTHPSGSLKHRLARSLFLYGLCNGWIREETPVIEASSGSTAISEAHFARLIGARFVAVIPRSTSKAKIAAIEHQGGHVHCVASAQDASVAAAELARETDGVFLDQFTNAERATDWRGNNNIAESLFSQMQREPHPIPDWVVVGAGTGGTSSTIGRYIRYQRELAARTKLCVVDPEGSCLFSHYARDDSQRSCGVPSLIEGIGRPTPPASFFPDIIDRMLSVPDVASITAVHWLEALIGRRCGPSTGTNLIGALSLAHEMRAAGRRGSIVTLICDGGERYADTVYDASWLKDNAIDVGPTFGLLRQFERTGRLDLQLRSDARMPAR